MILDLILIFLAFTLIWKKRVPNLLITVNKRGWVDVHPTWANVTGFWLVGLVLLSVFNFNFGWFGIPLLLGPVITLITGIAKGPPRNESAAARKIIAEVRNNRKS